MKSMLLVVDPQIDFIAGSLPVPGAEPAMDNLAEWIRDRDYALKVVTLDFHPWNHCSFKNMGGQWPRHCVRHSSGAAIWPALMQPLFDSGRTLVLRKGTDQEKDEYSIFANATGCEMLKNAINEENISRIDICGIAGDICVLNTLKDGIACFGADMFSILDRFSPSLDGGKSLREFMRRQ